MPRADAIAQAFQLEGLVQNCEILKVGNIHHTWLVSCSKDNKRYRYVLQHLNTLVFHDPQQLMANLEAICSYLKEHPVAGFQSLSLVPSEDGDSYYIDQDGQYWRCYPYIENSRFFDSSIDLEVIEQAGLAFGAFIMQLSAYPLPLPLATIARFHDGCLRLEQLQQAIAEDRCQRVALVTAEIAFFLERRELLLLLGQLLEQGSLPQRLCHNDTKLNNVLFDQQQQRAICVIDIDTVMPGTLLYDFGDLLRSCGSGYPEDGLDLEHARLQLPLFKAALRGFLAGCGNIITAQEQQLLVQSIIIMTLLIGSRFLCDFLNGDPYFRIDHPQHNLDRVRNQIALVSSIEGQRSQLEDVVATYLKHK